MNIKDNPPPLPEPAIEDHDYELWGQNVRGNFFSEEQYRAGEAAAFARGVASMQAEIERLTEHLAERGASLMFQGEQLQKAVAELDELRAKLKALEEQKMLLELARDALKKAATQLSVLQPNMQCDEYGNGPDCTDYFQAQIDVLHAEKSIANHLRQHEGEKHD